MRSLSVSSLLLALLLSVPAPADEATRLGRVDFPNSGAAEAQDDFVQGVLLLHSFEYEDAREAFQAAQAIDPDFAMAHWGEALTHDHPLWREKDREAAREALAEYGPTAEARGAKAPTARERAYLAAVDVLFADGDEADQDRLYSEAMGALSAAHPDDLEAKALWALSILGTTQGERDFATYMRAASVAEEVFDANPRHPGAVHYLIHSYDDPIHAPLGLRAARVYAEIAPAASHAQHMISHIYVALGWWDESVEANDKAVRVSEERARRKGLGENVRSHHALHWLQYAYLQQGLHDAARAELDVLIGDREADPSRSNRWYEAHMRAGQAVETGDWSVVPRDVDVSDTGIDAVAVRALTVGMADLHAGDVDAATALLAELGEARRAAVDRAAEGEIERRDSPADLAAAAVMEEELAGLVALHRGDQAEALRHLGRATELESATPLSYGPPVVVKPSYELLGEALLRLDRPAEAMAAFESALERAPRRTLSLLGLAKAARATGDETTALAATEELAAIRRKAGP